MTPSDTTQFLPTGPELLTVPIAARNESARAEHPRITFIGAHGNAGDAVITLATEPWIQKLATQEDTIIFKGGGLGHHANLHRLLDGLPRDQQLIVAPTSLDRTAAAILATFPKVHVFCRGTDSLAIAQAHGIPCELEHDLATGIDYAPWKDLPAAGKLNCFRGDVESATNFRPADNEDISLMAHEAWTPENCTAAAHRFIRTIAGYEVVHTDRLHVGIIAGMLGRETHLYAGVDHKIPEVHALSLSHLDHVTLHRAHENHVGMAPEAVIIHQSARQDRKPSVIDLFRKVGNCRMLEAIAPQWESAPANVAVRGCSLSHLSALRRHGGGGPLLVLEDDAEVIPAAYESWLDITEFPADCGAVLLGGDVEHHAPAADGWHEVLPPFWGSQAVAYNTPLLEKTDFVMNALEILASNQVGPHGNGFGLCYESVLLMALNSVGLKLYCRADHAFTTRSDASARSGGIEPPRMHSISSKPAA